MPAFDEELEQDVIEFGRRINARPPDPVVPKPTLQTEIHQLEPDQTRRFLALNDAQLGFQYLKDGASSGQGN